MKKQLLLEEQLLLIKQQFVKKLNNFAIIIQIFAQIEARERELQKIRDGEIQATKKIKSTSATKKEAFKNYMSLFFDRPKVQVRYTMMLVLYPSEPTVVWLRDLPRDRRVAGLIPETTDFLTISCGQASNALVSLCSPSSVNWYQLASRLGVRHCVHLCRAVSPRRASRGHKAVCNPEICLEK